MGDQPEDPERAPETLAAQALGRTDPVTRAIVEPLHPSTTYLRDPDGAYRSGRGYTRPQNPTYDAPEDLLSALEGGQSALLFASGMAAATAVFQSLLPGDHVIAPRVMYWALRKWIGQFAVTWGLEVDFVDTTDLERIAAAVRPGRTRLVWLETPANPTWEVTDIRGACTIAHAHNARVAVDSTVGTPVLTRPIQHGADLVVHSATKYLNGHSDVLAGAIVTARRDPFWQRIKAWHGDGGAVLGPFEAWLLLRGMRTLFVRVRHASASALAVAQHFQAHPKIVEVLYPGLPEHPQHALAARQMEGGFSGMLSLRVAGGESTAVATAARVALFKRATSLGGVESLIEHRASIEGPSTPVPRDLLRLSIGLERVEDLVADLEQALADAPTGNEAPAPRAEPPATVRALVDEVLRPATLDRGGDLQLLGAHDGVARLRASGSPGAALGLRETYRRTLEGVEGVRSVDVVFGEPGEADLAQVVDQVINPALAAHGGRIRLERHDRGTAWIAFEGRCQGCAMAEVTLRQGVEVLIAEHCPSVVTVVDVTDHAAGTDPYYAPGKGGEPGGG